MNQISRRLTRAINRLFPSHRAGPKAPYVEAPSGRRLWYVTFAVAGPDAEELADMLLKDCRLLAKRFPGRLYWRVAPVVAETSPKHAIARMRLAIDDLGFSAETCGLLCSTFKPECLPMLDLRNVAREIARSVALP